IPKLTKFFQKNIVVKSGDLKLE
ncbi:uncharacterized protein METZ01_LOCUS509367, partial [marine metagenome]